MTGYYPIFVDLRGRPVVLLGGGATAAGKVPALLRAGADLTVVAARVEPGVADAARQGRLRWVERAYEPGDLRGTRLVVDASDDPEVNRQARAEADREGALLNVVDRTALCDWIAPAVVDRGPLKIAVSTAGESPFLASAIRRRLEREFGEEWEPFLRLVGAFRRRLRSLGVAPAEQERRYRRALRSPARRLLREGRVAEARAAVEERADGPGRVTLAGAGPGSPDHLTRAVREALFEADLVLHDALVDPRVLALCGAAAEIRSVGKRAGAHYTPQDEIVGAMVEAARAGRDVLRLKGGDPFVFGRGGEELAALREAGLEVSVLPGVSSATGGPTLAGIPLTLRGVSASVTFCTAHTQHGPADLRRFARSADTLVVLMALGRAPEIARELAVELGEDHPVAVVAGASTPREAVLRTTLGTLATGAGLAGLEAPALLVAGQVVAAAQNAGVRPPGATPTSAPRPLRGAVARRGREGGGVPGDWW